jgi:uncharacterized protein (DUF302 family)
MVMRYVIGIVVSLFYLVSLASAGNGLVNVRSAHGVKATADRLEAGVKDKGMTVFNRIDHAAGAATVGQKLRPMELLIFGKPAVGTKLIQCSQTMGIDLPLKALIWEDGKGTVWLSYSDPKFLSKRHAIKGCDEVVKKIENVLKSLAGSAVSPAVKEK